MANRRERKTDHGVSDFDALLNAIKAIKIEKKRIRPTARAYSISKTSLTRYVEKLDKEVADISKLSDVELLAILRRIASYATPKLVFNGEEGEALVVYLVRCCHLYYGLSITELRQLAYQYARKLNIAYPTNWDTDQMAGKTWYYGFMLRHRNLSLRTPEQTSINRIRSFCKENVKQFFDQYKGLMDIHHFEPHQIWNMDESGFSTVPTKFGKVIAVKGLKRIGLAAAAERDNLVTMALSVNADGNSVPPFFVFPRKNMQSYFMDSAPPTAGAACNESGWMKQVEFVKYMEHFIKYVSPSLKKPALLLLDNHTSHLSIEAIDLALDNGIVMLAFPPHCSHYD
ncbi:uncharacterized protein LOC116350086 [Contarinia nasturtii]|uniref:uncharacterized protein LOC116350086 n=1 Tax=Contarinia nasturtii TaxID=265458 RepID=UPI0012D43788|nr:uncharacterized protein LOC116350086 [Contarinia nasturtii]